MDLKQILEYSLFETGTFKLTVYRLLIIFTMFAVAKFALWSIKKGMARQSRFSKLDAGNKHALFIIVRYLIWVIVITLALEMLDIKVTILVAGSAALLVGVGLGIQQTFNDIVSGLILLVEGSIKVGDNLEIDFDVVRVEKIGLRASNVKNRDGIIIFVPNSLLVTNKVINWSHQEKETRYHIKVGVVCGTSPQ